MDYEIIFLKALLLTVLIETSVLFLIFKTLLKSVEANNYILLLTGILASSATLPYLWFIFPLFIKSKIWYTIFSESFAIVAESFIIKGLIQINYTKSLIISIICNAISYIIGLLINWP
jgi:hypothetical protein